MSHELRTPLNSIIGYANLLIEDSDNLGEDQLEDLRVIRSSGTHLLSLITDLLDLSRIEAGKVELRLEQVDLAKLLRDTVSSLRPQADAASGVELVVDAPEQLTLTCDRSRVRQMLLNVLGNALKFTERGEVRTILAPAPGGGAHITVRDTGPGIPPADLTRIFESFFQSDAALARTPHAAEGAGLGLAITQMLVELHGGTVTIESTLDVGTTVSMELPATPPAAPADDAHG
jgi:signal transduction histidine kinase